jgi:hypothetical protein
MASVETTSPEWRHTVTLRAEDVYHSEIRGRSIRPSGFAVLRAGSRETATNAQPRATEHRSFDTAIFVSNALDSQPTLLNSADDPFSRAATFRPRTIGVSATWHY